MAEPGIKLRGLMPLGHTDFLPLTLWLPVGSTNGRQQKETGGWEERGAGVFIPQLPPSSTQSLWSPGLSCGYSSLRILNSCILCNFRWRTDGASRCFQAREASPALEGFLAPPAPCKQSPEYTPSSLRGPSVSCRASCIEEGIGLTFP